MRRVTGLLIIAGAWALAGCASHAPVNSAESGTGGASGALKASTAAAKNDQFKPPSDYRRVVVNGQEKFCRKFYATGTRAESRTECLTEAELKDRANSNRLMLEEAQRVRAATPGGGAPAGLGH